MSDRVNTTDQHTNGFINLNGVPYLLDEYIEQNNFQQIDRANVKSDVTIDTTEDRTAIVDISIDDIGETSDGSLNIIGNYTKQQNLIEMIKNGIYRLEHHLPVLKKGIIVRVNYQLENQRTGQILKSLQEEINIAQRNYFVEISAKDLNDTAVIANFADSAVSTIAEYTHGTDPIQLRITSIQLYYECVRPPKFKPFPGRPPLYRIPPEAFVRDGLHDEQEMYYYHKGLQNRQYMGEKLERPWDVIPQQWYDFNRFYHFETDGKDIILHDNEINADRTRILRIPCGYITVNRTFVVYPGQRIVFRFSIWKNDLCVVTDTTSIAEALGVNTTPYYPPTPSKDNDSDSSKDSSLNNTKYPSYMPDYPYDPFYLMMLMNQYNQLQNMTRHADTEQNEIINKLSNEVKELSKIVKEQHTDANVPDIDNKELPTDLHKPVPPIPPPPTRDKTIKVLIEMLKSLQNQLNDVKTETGEGTPLTAEQIQELLDALEKDYDDDGKYNGSVNYPDDTKTDTKGSDAKSDDNPSTEDTPSEQQTSESSTSNDDKVDVESSTDNTEKPSTVNTTSAKVARSAADLV